MAYSTCLLEGCERDAFSRNLCPGHFKRWQKNGDDFDQGPLRGSAKTWTPRVCSSTPDCDKRVFQRDLCRGHYKRFLEQGPSFDRSALARRSSREASFADLIAMHSGQLTSSGCMEWTGALSESGYGVIRKGRKLYRAHRVSYELLNGPIPDELVVRHACDNPPCVNPDHLTAGTKAQNSRDMAERDRSTFGTRSRHAVLTDEIVLAMRKQFSDGHSVRSIAVSYGFKRTTVSAAVHGRTWKRA